MDRDLFEARSKYLIKICHDQGSDDCDDAENLVNDAITTLKLPNWAEKLALRNIVRVRSIFSV
jgi:hypothetical protein